MYQIKSGGETIFLELNKLEEILKEDNPELLDFYLLKISYMKDLVILTESKILYWQDRKVENKFQLLLCFKTKFRKILKVHREFL